MSAAVGADVSVQRTAELAENLAAARARIATACAAVGRHPGSVTLIAVTKTRPAADVVALAGLGVTDVGENRDRDAAAKAVEVAAMTGAGAALRWHMIGQLQSNKVRSVLGWADAVHSVDRERLLHSLERAAADAGRVLDCFVQVDLRDPALAAADPGRGGARPALVPALADAVADCSGLRLRGLMAVAPVDGDPAAAFAALARLADVVRRDHPGADALSAGMSGDLEAAVAAGATHVRVGSAVLGSRPPLH